MKYIKFELQPNGDGTYKPCYFDADDGITKEEQDNYNLIAAQSRDEPIV
jgi:hypothetical protein